MVYVGTTTNIHAYLPDDHGILVGAFLPLPREEAGRIAHAVPGDSPGHFLLPPPALSLLAPGCSPCCRGWPLLRRQARSHRQRPHHILKAVKAPAAATTRRRCRRHRCRCSRRRRASSIRTSLPVKGPPQCHTRSAQQRLRSIFARQSSGSGPCDLDRVARGGRKPANQHSGRHVRRPAVLIAANEKGKRQEGERTRIG